MIRVVFLILIIISCVPASRGAVISDGASYWNRQRGYHGFRYGTQEGVCIHNTTSAGISDGVALDHPLERFTLSFRTRNNASHPSKRYLYSDSDGRRRGRTFPEWGFYLKYPDSDTLRFIIRNIEKEEAESRFPAIEVTAYCGRSAEESAALILKDISFFDDMNAWYLSADKDGVRLRAGDSGLSEVMEIALPGKRCEGFGFIASPGADIRVSDIKMENHISRHLEEKKIWGDEEAIREHLEQSRDPLEGYWTIYDRTLEETLLRLGGHYKLAIVRDSDIYLLLYLSGAEVNPSSWFPGMIKGRLRPDPFTGIYSVEWIDCEGNAMSKDIKAQAEEGEVLMIQFPYQSSSLRLRRLSTYP